MNRFLTILPLLFAISHGGYLEGTHDEHGNVLIPQHQYSVFNEAASGGGASGFGTSGHPSGYEATDGASGGGYEGAAQHQFGGAGGHVFLTNEPQQHQQQHSFAGHPLINYGYSGQGHEVSGGFGGAHNGLEHEMGQSFEHVGFAPSGHNGGYDNSGFSEHKTGFEGHNGGFDGHSFGGQNSGFEGHNFGGQNSGFEGHNFGGQNSGFDGHNFGGQNSGFEEHNGGFEGHNGGFEQHGQQGFQGYQGEDAGQHAIEFSSDDAGHDGGMIDLSLYSGQEFKGHGGHGGGGHGGDHGGHGDGGHKGYEKHILSEVHHHHKSAPKVSYKDSPINVHKAIIVPVAQPYPIKIPISKPIAVPDHKELKITVEKHIPYKVEKKIPFKVEKYVPYKVVKTIPVYVPKPYPVKVPIYKTIIHKVKSSKH